MKKLSTYKSFLESNQDYSIYDFYYDLRHGDISEHQAKKYSEKFIAKGIYDRVDNFVEDMFETFEGIELEDIEYKLTDVTDNLEVETLTMFGILNCEYTSLDRDIQSRFNSVKGVKNDNESRIETKFEILRDMIHPTLTIYRLKGEIRLRTTAEEIYVLDDKFTCKNFDVSNLSDFRNINMELSSHKMNILKSYDINKFFECYVPGIYIRLKNDDYSYTMNLKKLESDLDKTLPRILSDIPHKEVIWGSSRFSRKFDDDTDIYDYTIKIILE
jgi:hypothetical protein